MSLVMAVLLVSSQLFHTEILNLGNYGLASHLDGTVYRPFAYRVLTDWLIRQAARHGMNGLPLPRLGPIVRLACRNQLETPPATCGQIGAYAVVATTFAWGFLVTTYLAGLRIFGDPLWGLMALLLGALGVNALLLQHDGQPYDFTVLFFSMSLFLVADRQLDTWFGIAFAFACLTKESLGLFSLIYALIGFGRRSTAAIICNLTGQSAIFVIIYTGERRAFQSNAGSPMYHNLSGHLHYALDSLDLQSLFLMLLFAVLVLYHIADKALSLRRGMLILPVLFALYIVGGNPGEFRITFEMFPFILLPAVDTLKRLITSRAGRTS